MMCYRDMTFCDAPCEAGCQRRLTESVKVAATIWWGGPDAPIAVADLRESCKRYAPPAPRAPADPSAAKETP